MSVASKLEKIRVAMVAMFEEQLREVLAEAASAEAASVDTKADAKADAGAKADADAEAGADAKADADAEADGQAHEDAGGDATAEPTEGSDAFEPVSPNDLDLINLEETATPPTTAAAHVATNTAGTPPSAVEPVKAFAEKANATGGPGHAEDPASQAELSGNNEAVTPKSKTNASVAEVLALVGTGHVDDLDKPVGKVAGKAAAGGAGGAKEFASQSDPAGAVEATVPAGKAGGMPTAEGPDRADIAFLEGAEGWIAPESNWKDVLLGRPSEEHAGREEGVWKSAGRGQSAKDRGARQEDKKLVGTLDLTNKYSVLAKEVCEEAREAYTQGAAMEAQLEASKERERLMAREIAQMAQIQAQIQAQMAQIQGGTQEGMASFQATPAGSCKTRAGFGNVGCNVPLACSPLACLVATDTRSRLSAPVGADDNGDISVSPKELKVITTALAKVPVLKEQDAKSGTKLLAWTETVREALSIFPRRRYGQYFANEVKGRIDLNVQTKLRSRLGGSWSTFHTAEGLTRFFTEIGQAYCPNSAASAVQEFNKATQAENECWEDYIDRLLRYQSLSTMSNDSVLNRVDITLSDVVQRALQTAKPALKLKLEEKLEVLNVNVADLQHEQDLQMLRKVVRKQEDYLRQEQELRRAEVVKLRGGDPRRTGDPYRGGDPDSKNKTISYAHALPLLTLVRKTINPSMKLPDGADSISTLQKWWTDNEINKLSKPTGVSRFKDFLTQLCDTSNRVYENLTGRLKEFVHRRVEAKANQLGLAHEFSGPPLLLQDRTNDRCTGCDTPLRDLEARDQWRGYENCTSCHKESLKRQQRSKRGGS